MNEIMKKGKKLMTSPQSSILSAATLIMVMVIAAKILGFVKQRVLFTYFVPEETDLLLAAFDVPDILFEVLVFGIVSAAFIPVFSSYITQKKETEGWHMASSSLNIVLITYLLLALIAFIFLNPIYTLLVGESTKIFLGVEGGFSQEKIDQIVSISRILLLSQVFFVISAFMTGVLESYKRFLIPAIAPLFYNLSIILGIVFLASSYGLMAAAIGAVFGAFLHLMIQVPIAGHLGFRPKLVLDLRDEGVRKLFKLSAPRVLELSVYQVKRFVWLFLGTVVAGGVTYLKSADLLQTLPVGVFGMSMAKAALPTLSYQASKKDYKSFKKTFFTTLNQILFLVIPLSVFMVILRVPMVRLVFGASQFNWEATITTGRVLSAFAVGMFAYSSSMLITRAFYALEDTKTPVTISIMTVVVNVITSFVFVLSFGMGVIGIALSYALAGLLQFTLLILIIVRRMNSQYRIFLLPFGKMVVASLISGGIIYLLIKLLDRSFWINGNEILGTINKTGIIAEYVVDTRYAGNLFLLTAFVSMVGFAVYLIVLIILRSQEVWEFIGYAKRLLVKRKISPIPNTEEEQIAPSPTDTTST